MKIITLCGSLKFQKEMMIIAEKMALEGNCILTPVFPVLVNYERTEEQLKKLKEEHFKRIELSDAILVINIDNYIGNSTNLEIEYARKLEKEIIYYTDLIKEKKMKVLFATTNQAKIKRYASKLQDKGIEVLTLKDIDIKLEVDETGKNAIENAYLKAKAYYEATGIVSIGLDNNLFIEELPEDKQPGTHVRRVNGKELTDEEMIDYYTKLVRDNGGKLTAKWVYGMVIYNGNEPKEYTWAKDHFYFVHKPHEKRHPGYPLDSISIMPEFNKYFVELTQEEKNRNINNEDDVINFIVKSLV